MIRQRLAGVRSRARALKRGVAERWSRSRAWKLRFVALAVVLLLLAPAAASAVTHDPVALQRGTIEQPANGTTAIAVQGFKGAGQSSAKKPARLVGAGPRGETEWVIENTDNVNWFYDVDPLSNGDLLVVGVDGSGTTVFRYDPQSGERRWTEHFDYHDTHDVDLINGDELLISNMRNYNETAERNDDRLVVYNRTRGEEVWEWHFREIYDRENGGDYTDDWTHANDVDKIGEGRYLASPRNMDQVIVVNRSTKDVELRLGEDDNHSALYEQHNPDYLETEDGRPTILVADSENDRVVEYTLESGADGNATWNRTWELGTEGRLTWPRDADRLPNGNTLVTDTHNHRVIEVTPDGRVVWEYYAPWGTYEAARTSYANESGGPTIADQNATGAYAVTNSAELTPGSSGGETFAHWLSATFAGTPLEAQAEEAAASWAHLAPWVRPRWMTPWAFVCALGATLLTVGWGATEAVTQRRRLWRGARRLAGRLTGSSADPSEEDPTDD